MANSQIDVLIVGGGFSGTMLAVHLLRRTMQARSFPPRKVYGEYLESLLKRRGGDRFHWIQDEALSLQRRKGELEHLAVQCKDGCELLARAVVLATGNFPPATPKIPGLESGNSLYVQFAWAENALDKLPQDGSVLKTEGSKAA